MKWPSARTALQDQPSEYDRVQLQAVVARACCLDLSDLAEVRFGKLICRNWKIKGAKSDSWHLATERIRRACEIEEQRRIRIEAINGLEMRLKQYGIMDQKVLSLPGEAHNLLQYPVRDMDEGISRINRSKEIEDRIGKNLERFEHSLLILEAIDDFVTAYAGSRLNKRSQICISIKYNMMRRNLPCNILDTSDELDSLWAQMQPIVGMEQTESGRREDAADFCIDQLDASMRSKLTFDQYQEIQDIRDRCAGNNFEPTELRKLWNKMCEFQDSRRCQQTRARLRSDESEQLVMPPGVHENSWWIMIKLLDIDKKQGNKAREARRFLDKCFQDGRLPNDGDLQAIITILGKRATRSPKKRVR